MFHRMKIFTVHLQPQIQLSNQKPVFLKEGFNLFAFLLPFIWALYNRLWFMAVLLVGWQVFLMALLRSGMFGPAGMAALDLGMHVIVGYAANDLLRSSLTRRGYIFSDVSVADSRLRAEQRYFDRCFAA